MGFKFFHFIIRLVWGIQRGFCTTLRVVLAIGLGVLLGRILNHTGVWGELLAASDQATPQGFYVRAGYPSNKAYEVYENPFVPPNLKTAFVKAAPQLKRVGQNRKLKVVFLLDNSGSMEHNDPGNHRFLSVKKLFQDKRVLRNVREAAVIVFSDKAQTLLPFTPVGVFVQEFNQALELTQKGHLSRPLEFSKGKTDLDAPFKALDRLLASEKNTEPLAVILLSDGVPTYLYQNSHLFLKEKGIPIFTIGYNRFEHPIQGRQRVTRSSNKVQQADFNEKFLRTLSEVNQGKFLSASANSIQATYKEMVQTISQELSPLSITTFKKRYAPNELMILTYELNLDKVDAKQYRGISEIDSCRIKTHAGQRPDPALSRTNAFKSTEMLPVQDYIPLKLFKENRVSAIRKEIYFYPLAIGQYNVTLQMYCGREVDYKKSFDVTFDENARTLQITDALYLTKQEREPYAKKSYFNLRALTDITVLGLYYHPNVERGKRMTARLFTINFIESEAQLKAEEHKLQAYQIIRVSATKKNETKSQQYSNGARVSPITFESGNIEIVSSQGHYLFHTFIEAQGIHQALYPVWNYKDYTRRTPQVSIQSYAKQEQPNTINIPTRTPLPLGNQANVTDKMSLYKAAVYQDRDLTLENSLQWSYWEAVMYDGYARSQLWHIVRTSFLGSLLLVLGYLMSVIFWEFMKRSKRRTFLKKSFY